MNDDGCDGKRPGRPIGYKVSDTTKRKIRVRRVGTHHSDETKDKISMSLAKYFKSRDPLTESLIAEYENVSGSASIWLSSNKKEIDALDDVMTSKRLFYLEQLELCIGNDINNVSHETTPEFMLLLKETLQELGMSEELDELNSLFF